MSYFTLYHTNTVETAALSGGSWQPNLPLMNMLNPITTKRARSTNAQLASTQFRVALADSITAHGIQIIATNLSSAALYRISWYTDQTYTAEIDDTGWISIGISINWANQAEWFDWLSPDFWLGATGFLDPDNQGVDIRHTFSQPTSVKYLKIEFDDVTNAKAYVEVGHLYIGHAFVPSINVSPDPIFQRISLTSSADAIGGAQYFNRRGSRKRLVITWPLLPQEEVLDDIDEIVRIHDIDKPVYVDLDPDNLQSGRNTAFLARIHTLPESKLVLAFLEEGTAATVGFEFIQVL